MYIAYSPHEQHIPAIHIIYSTGGPWLVTDVRRGESLFDLDLTAEVCPTPFPPLHHSHPFTSLSFIPHSAVLCGRRGSCGWFQPQRGECSVHVGRQGGPFRLWWPHAFCPRNGRVPSGSCRAAENDITGAGSSEVQSGSCPTAPSGHQVGRRCCDSLTMV